MFSHGASQVWLTWDRANTNTDGEAHKPGVDTGQDSEKVLVIPVLTLWPSPSNGPLTLVLMPCSVPNVLIVMVCNLLLLSVPGRNELAEQEEKDQKNIDLGMSLFKRERSNDDAHWLVREQKLNQCMTFMHYSMIAMRFIIHYKEMMICGESPLAMLGDDAALCPKLIRTCPRRNRDPNSNKIRTK